MKKHGSRTKRGTRHADRGGLARRRAANDWDKTGAFSQARRDKYGKARESLTASNPNKSRKRRRGH